MACQECRSVPDEAMCLANLLGQDGKYTCAKSRNELQAGVFFPHPMSCNQVFHVDKLAGFTHISATKTCIA